MSDCGRLGRQIAPVLISWDQGQAMFGTGFDTSRVASAEVADAYGFFAVPSHSDYTGTFPGAGGLAGAAADAFGFVNQNSPRQAVAAQGDDILGTGQQAGRIAAAAA